MSIGPIALDEPEPIVLDYAGAADVEVLVANLSGIAVSGDIAWTVSDERRTLEALVAVPSGFSLARQYKLDDWFAALPAGHEADLESIDIADGRVWIAGSHCRVRKEAEFPALAKGIRSRRSRNLFGSIRIGTDGGLARRSAEHLPFTGKNSLRERLKDNRYLASFLDLPSKENGLDIEGLVVLPDRLLLGLRGPVLDSMAVVLSFARRKSLADLTERPQLYALPLGGLGIRDLCRLGDDVLVMAGPVTAADRPFRLFRWSPAVPLAIKQPDQVHEWPDVTGSPEGICLWRRGERPGLLVVYDKPTRVSGSRVIADWFPLRSIA